MRKLSLLFFSVSLAACANQIPLDAQPQEVPEEWQHAQQQQQGDWPDEQWWQQFGSEELLNLQQQAKEQGTDLAAMTARMLQADYQLKISGISKVPSVEASLGGEHGGSISGGNESSRLNAGMSASYEVDIWGRLKEERRAAALQWQGTQFEQEAVKLSVSAEVGRRYVELLAQQEKERIAKLQLKSAEDVLKVVSARVRAGAVSRMDQMRQEAQLSRQRAALHPIQQQIAENKAELATILGTSASELSIDGTLADLDLPTTNVGLASDLLLRRPDLREQETRLYIAEADVKVARAAMFPAIRLTANTSQRGDTWSELWRGSWMYNIGASLTQPIFQGGKLKAEHKLSQAKQIELLEDYRGSLLKAFSEVEVALHNMDTLEQQLTAQQAVLNTSEELFHIAERRYREGADDLLSLLEAQQSLYNAQDAILSLQQQQLLAHITLYSALGGGWDGQLQSDNK